MKIEVLLTETEIADEFSEAMEARDLPEKFFYWFPLSVRAWLSLSKHAAYASLLQSWDQLFEHAEINRDFQGEVSLLSLGAGDGSKDRLLLKALQSADRQVDYFPVDASQALLELACSAAEDDEIETLGLKADISSPVHLVLVADAAESPKLILMCGNTLGAFDPLDQVRHLGQCLRGDDRLIVDGEIHNAAPITARDDAMGREFAFAPLASIGLTQDDGEIRFEQKRDERHEGLYLTTKHFRAGRDLRLAVSGKEITLQRGERVNMNFCYTYTLPAFRWLLAEHGGLKILHEIKSSDGMFVTAVCSR